MILLQAPPAQIAAPAAATLKARYDWGYLGADGEGRGTFDVLLDLPTGRVVLELHGLGERLMLLQGEATKGYRLQIPRQKVDDPEVPFKELDLPFLPQLGSVEALARLLREGAGQGVNVTKRDAQGPVKLRFEGKDPDGKAVKVWLTRLRYEPGPASPPAPRP